MPDPVKKTIDEKLDAIGEHIDSLHEKHDAGSKRMDALNEGLGALTGRLDALEGEKEKAKADAAQKAAAEFADAVAKTGSEEDRAKFANAQMRCDSAYQAWGKQAPHALYGESLRDFQIRLLTPLKKHSNVYKDSALSLIGDDATFGVVQDSIIADAVAASTSTYTAMAPLRKITTKMDSGHIQTRFVGDPRVGWAEFSGGATKFGRINAGIARARN
jgi:hypothetical protein